MKISFSAFLILFIGYAVSCSTATKIDIRDAISAEFGHVTAVCDVKTPAKKVFIFKQWHLTPTVDTTQITSQSLPQERNQTAIYKQIELWIQNGVIDSVIAEGCEGEINDKFKTKYNGWDYDLLKANSKVLGYEHIISLIPLKIAAKENEKIHVLCGDSNDLINKSNLELSNIRGLTGFAGRLKDFADDRDKLKNYLNEVVRVLKLPSDTTVEVAHSAIRDEIRTSIGKIKDYISQRDDVFVKNILSNSSKRPVLVIGGAHADDLRIKLEKNNIGCDVIEPIGYDFDPEAMFKAALEI